MTLSDKTALVTGGSEGLGFSIAKKLLEAGCSVYICGRNTDRLDKAKAELASDKLYTVQCDVSEVAEVQQMITDIDHLDILVNNAGIWMEGPAEEDDPARLSAMVDVNLKGVMYCTQAVLPQMKQRDSGIIFNVSSTAGTYPRANLASYNATKYGVRGYTDSLKEEFKSTGVRVHGFYPGGMNTKLFEKGGDKKDNSAWMDTDDVADIVVFMLTRPDNMHIDHLVVQNKGGK